MAYYNSYYSTGYANPYYAAQPNYNTMQAQTYANPIQMQQPQQQQQQAFNNNGIVLIASEGDAQSYPVAPGNTQWMKDQYKDYLYVKTVDVSGMIMPLRKFKLIEETNGVKKEETENTKKEPPKEFNPDLYVTWEALEQRLAEKLSKPSIASTNKIPTSRKVNNNNEPNTNV